MDGDNRASSAMQGEQVQICTEIYQVMGSKGCSDGCAKVLGQAEQAEMVDLREGIAGQLPQASMLGKRMVRDWEQEYPDDILTEKSTPCKRKPAGIIKEIELVEDSQSKKLGTIPEDEEVKQVEKQAIFQTEYECGRTGPALGSYLPEPLPRNTQRTQYTPPANSLLENNEYLATRVCEGVQRVGMEDGFLQFGYKEFLHELMKSELDVRGNPKYKDWDKQKLEKELDTRRFDVLQEFLYTFSWEKMPDPWRDTKYSGKESKTKKEVLLHKHRVQKPDQEEEEPKQSRYNKDSLGINGIKTTALENMEKLTLKELGQEQLRPEGERNIRCEKCVDQTGQSQVFQNAHQKVKHLQEKHKTWICNTCGVIKKSKRPLMYHRQKDHPEEEGQYRCPMCPEMSFGTIQKKWAHQESSEGKRCMLSCEIGGCEERFHDEVEKDYHMSLNHRGPSFKDISLNPLGSVKNTKFLDEEEQMDWLEEIMEASEDGGLPQEIWSEAWSKDDLISIRAKSGELGWLRIGLEYKDNHTWAVLKDYKLPGTGAHELGIVIQKLQRWLNEKNVATFYIHSSPQMHRFWRSFKYFPVWDEEHLERAGQVKRCPYGQTVMSIRTKEYFKNEPKQFKFPENMKRTGLSNQLRRLRGAMFSSGADKLLIKMAQETIAKREVVSKKSAKKSDQEQTPKGVFEHVARKLRLPKSVLWDLHRFRPNWSDKGSFNNLKNKYPGLVHWSNQPYSLTQENLIWSAVNWLDGKSTVFLTPTSKNYTILGQSVVEAFASKQGTEGIIFEGHSKPLETNLDIIYMVTPELIEYINHRQGVDEGEGQAGRNQAPVETLITGNMDKEKKDIVLRLLSQKISKREVREIAKTDDRFVDQFTKEQIEKFRRMADKEV